MKMQSKTISKSTPTFAKGGGKKAIFVPGAAKTGKMPKAPNLGASLNPQKGPMPKKK